MTAQHGLAPFQVSITRGNLPCHRVVPLAHPLSREPSAGPWFSELTVTWKGGRPPDQTPDTFIPEGPG